MWCHLRESERIFIIYSTELLRDAIPDHTLQSSLCFYTVSMTVDLNPLVHQVMEGKYLYFAFSPIPFPVALELHWMVLLFTAHWSAWSYLLRPVFFLTLSVYYHCAGCSFVYWNHLGRFFPVFLNSIVQSFWQEIPVNLQLLPKSVWREIVSPVHRRGFSVVVLP